LRSETSFDRDSAANTNQLPTGNHTPARPPRDAVELAMDVLSDRWTFLILREAFFGVRRYGQMQRNLGIARNVLADRLRELVAHGMFERVRYRTDPDWYEYRLTQRALDLYPVIVGLMRWADQHLATEDDAGALELIHRSCGRPAEPYLACSHCHEPLTGREIEARVRSAG
jgi:DNA-binding HxlR family transcriptional regulator